MQNWLLNLVTAATKEEAKPVGHSIAAAASNEQARQVADRTAQLLETQGWCLWRCEAHRGDIITVVRDDGVEGIPEGIPIYTESELESLFGGEKLVSAATLRLIHEAKKRGCRIIGRESGPP